MSFLGSLIRKWPSCDLTPQVARVEPCHGKHRLRGALIFRIAFHADIAADHNFANSFAVCGNGLHSVEVKHLHPTLQVIAYALVRLELRLLIHGTVFPVFLLGAKGGSAEDLGQAVYMSEFEANRFHLGNGGLRW